MPSRTPMVMWETGCYT